MHGGPDRLIHSLDVQSLVDAARTDGIRERRQAHTADIVGVRVLAAFPAPLDARLADVGMSADPAFEQSFEQIDAVTFQSSASKTAVLTEAHVHPLEECLVNEWRDRYHDPVAWRAFCHRVPGAWPTGQLDTRPRIQCALRPIIEGAAHVPLAPQHAEHRGGAPLIPACSRFPRGRIEP